MIKTCVSGIILFISLCLTTVVNAADPVPVIEKERIIFTNSKVLEIKSYHVLHKDPLEAYRSHEPIRYQERAVLIEQWRRVIVSKHMNYFEGPRGEVRAHSWRIPLRARLPGSVCAGVAAKAHKRKKLERLCRYISRSALSEKRLSLTAQGKVRYQLKMPYRDGTTLTTL